MTNNLSATIKAALATGPSEESHRDIVDNLRARPLKERPAEELFLAYHYLQKIILLFESLDEARAGKPVREDHYIDEMVLLLEIADATQYSPALYRWANKRRADLMQALEQEGWYEKLDNWPNMDESAKEALLGALAALQAHIYKKGAIAFKVPDIEFLPAGHKTEGAVIVLPGGAIKLQLNRDLLTKSSPKPALLRLHHEMIHHMTAQFALAARDGKLQQNHPLRKDALLRLARLEVRGNAAARIGSLYSSDGEENLAYDQEAQFCMALSRPPKPLSPAELAESCLKMGDELQRAAKALGMDLTGTKWVDYRKLQPQVRQLKDQFNQFAFSLAYRQWSAQSRKELVEKLCADQEFRHAAENWAALPVHEKTTQIEKVSRNMVEIFSQGRRLIFPRHVVLSFYEKARPPGDTPYFERGRAMRSLSAWKCLISLNTHKDAGFNDFGTALDSAFHESLHALQFSLMDHPKAPDHKHKLADDIDMLRHSSKIPFHHYARILPLYRANPWERDAYGQSKKFVSELKAALLRNDS